MLIGIDDSVFFYMCFVKGQEQCHTILFFVFFTPVLKHLQNLTQKSNVSHINGEGYAKENKDLYQFVLQGWPSQ